MPLVVVEGLTAPISYQLLRDSVPYALTGYTVQLVGTKGTGSPLSFTGTLSVVDAASGKVDFLPNAADFKASDISYNVRWKVTRDDGKVLFFPRKRPEQWIVQAP